MGEKTFCSKCNNDTFEVFHNVYSEEVIAFDHHELVCKNCGCGCVIQIDPVLSKRKRGYRKAKEGLKDLRKFRP